MTRLFKSIKLFNALRIPVRYKNPDHHWSVLRKKKTSTMKALEHFDDFYKSVYGETWKNIRSALLSKNHKYVAVVNNFSDVERICQELENIGAMNIKSIYEASKKSLVYEEELNQKKKPRNEIQYVDKKLDEIVAEKQQEQNVYTNPLDDGKSDDENKDKKEDEFSSFKPVKLESIESNVRIADESDRLIKSSVGLGASQLYEFIPATKLKGLDDFVLESEHYGYYSKGADFIIQVEKEYKLNFPEKLLLYTFEENNFTKFPKSKTGSTDVSDYFVVDGASILPVLSLDLQPGDTFLDMCAAPGGKTMMALQTLYPRVIIANDVQESRVNRINSFVDEFLSDMGDWEKRLYLTMSDARFIEDKDIYNKILVDVPCTTDRHVLHEDDNNIFKGTRLKERLRLPELQSEILTNALKLAIPGGTVVYSTCSLSPIQNDGVVQMALKKAFEEANVTYVVKDQSPALNPLQYLFTFGNFGLRYGHIVIPTKSRNWGPMYFCKMVRVQ